MDDSHAPAGSIVVGVDGSHYSDHALDWAVEQAALERRPLVVLHAVDALAPGQASWLATPGLDRTRLTDALLAAGRDVLAQATSRVRQTASEVEVVEVLSPADPRNALMSTAADAALVVVGSRGRGPVSSLLLGSVSLTVSKQADCPVVVIRPLESAEPREGVLVGVDGTELDRRVVEFAYRMASLRALPLTVLHVFWDAAHLGRDEHVVPDDAPGLDDKRQLLRTAVQEMSSVYPDVDCRLELRRGFADRQMIERAQHMDVVVVGSHRPRGLQGLGFSSIAPTVVEHAKCAVAILPVDEG